MAFTTRRDGLPDMIHRPFSDFDEAAFSADMQAHLAAMQAESRAAALHPPRGMARDQTGMFNAALPSGIVCSPVKRSLFQSSPSIPTGFQELYTPTYLAPPTMPNYNAASPSKMAQFPSTYYQPIAQKPQKALFNTFPRAVKEEYGQAAPFSEPNMPQSDPITSTSKPLSTKRPAPEPASLGRERIQKQQKIEVEEPFVLPEPSDMPSLKDDGTKPSYSYATLIGMAILRAPRRRLTLNQIYTWISDTFSYYKHAETGWTNSIRHNLSLNKAFVKTERPKDDPGKGHYWTIEKGYEKQFFKDKTAKRVNSVEAPLFFDSDCSTGGRPFATISVANFALPPKVSRTVDSSTFPAEAEANSDATLPASDSASHEDRFETQMPPPPPPVRISRFSPAPMLFPSSPPVIMQMPATGTPPVVPRMSSDSGVEARRKRADSFRDSGFFSSIESSAVRGQQTAPLPSAPDNETDKSAVKRGRAEEELARMRGSLFDPSPTKNRAFRKPGSYLISSSPLRNFDSAGFAPLTPGTRLKPPMHAPPTVSPSTHLRRHRENIRELVGTPAQNLSTATTPAHLAPVWTPAFTIHRDDQVDYDTHSDIGLFTTPGGVSVSDFHGLPAWSSATDSSLSENFDTFFARGSPMKSTVKRPLLHRAATATGVLADVTGSRLNVPPSSKLGSPFKMLSSKREGNSFESPLHNMTMAGSQAIYNPTTPLRNVMQPEREEVMGKYISVHEDIFQYLDNTDDGDDLEGLDLAAGFRAIGANPMHLGNENNSFLASNGTPVHLQAQAGQPTVKIGRPAYGRSASTIY